MGRGSRLCVLGIALAIALARGRVSANEPSGHVPRAPMGAAPIVPRVELITMGQGPELFEKFGHAALCLVYDQGKRTTVCYNYGTTDFDSVVPLFWGFLRGESLFWVSTSTRGRMMAHYRASDRTVWRQILPLPPEKAIELAGLLAENARDENRYYKYHHYRDNCSSRLRDLLDRVTGGALSAASSTEHPSFRELSRRGFAGDTGLLLISDLMLGRVTDERPTTFEAMFLPDVLRVEVEARLGAEPVVLYERRGAAFPHDPGMGGRWLWIVLALAFAAPAALWRRSGRGRLVLAASVMPLALLGLLLWGVAFVSSLPELRWNEALLVFVPLDAALPFLSPVWRVRYATVRIALLLAIGVLHQPLWLLIPMPLLTMLLVALPRRALVVAQPAQPELAAPG
jgi:hypothetical protein